MNIKEIPRASYLDILFDGRNKTYGAYELRTHYARRARNAVIGVAVFTSLLMAYPLLASKERTHGPLISETIVKIAEVPPAPKKEPIRELPKPRDVNPAPRTATVSNPPPRVIEDKLVHNPPKENASLNEKAISNHDEDGLIGGPPAILTKPGTGTALVDQPKTQSDAPVRWVSQMPEFNGNMGAWLADHVQYPEAEHMDGKEGKAFVQFVVSEDGSISDVTLLRSSGAPGLDAEAIRVVKSMPRWKPGRNNGVPVKVFFQLPVAFVLNG